MVNPKEREGPDPLQDLRTRTYDLLSRVRRPSEKEQKALKETGWFFFPIAAKSLEQLVGENPGHFGYRRNLDRGYIPPSMAVAINLEQSVIPDSYGKSQAVQLAMIEKRSLARQKDFPDAREIMLPASALAQFDITVNVKKTRTDRMKEMTEIRFFEQRARALEGGSVGRAFPVPDLDLDVLGNSDLKCWALPSLVFVRK